MTEHARGPWRLAPGRSPARLISADNEILAMVYLTDDRTHRRTAQSLATAEVIAAAPDLLAAAKLAVQEIRLPPTGGLRCGVVLDKLNAAIAKAEGREP